MCNFLSSDFLHAPAFFLAVLDLWQSLNYVALFSGPAQLSVALGIRLRIMHAYVNNLCLVFSLEP